MTSSTDSADLPMVFIGSSSEAREICRYLQSELTRTGTCLTTVWDQGVFAPGSYTLDSLVEAARKSDFAVLVATPDDLVEMRSTQTLAPRDNVILELGLFLGAIGRERAYVLADNTRGLRLPTDMSGITYLPFGTPPDGNWRAALNDAVIGITERVRSLGVRPAASSAPSRADHNRRALDAEIELIVRAALAQGWTVKTRSDLTLRLQSTKGVKYTLPLGRAAASREDIRPFAATLRANGLRVSHVVREPVNESIYS